MSFSCLLFSLGGKGNRFLFPDADPVNAGFPALLYRVCMVSKRPERFCQLFLLKLKCSRKRRNNEVDTQSGDKLFYYRK